MGFLFFDSTTDFCEPPCKTQPQLNALANKFFNTRDDRDLKINEYDILQSTTTDAAVLKSMQYEIAGLQIQMDKDAYMISLHLLYDTIDISNDTIQYWLNNMDNLGAKLMLSREYLKNNEWSQVYNKLNEIIADSEVSSQKQNDIGYLIEILEIVEGKNIYQLSKEDIELIIPYTALNNAPSSKGLAQTLLSLYGYHYLPTYSFPEYDESQSFQYSIPSEINSSPIPSDVLDVYPNPAKDEVTFEWKIENEISKGEIVITNIHGSVIQRFNFTERVEQLSWQTDKLPNGIYYYQLSTDTLPLKSGRIAIFK